MATRIMGTELVELALVRAGFAVHVEKRLFMKGETLFIHHETGSVSIEVANRGGVLEIGKVDIGKKDSVVTSIKFDPYLLVPITME